MKIYESLEAPSPSNNLPEGELFDGVKYIQVVGSLVKREDDGYCSYEGILEELVEAINDTTVEEIVFLVDSCGGEAMGCIELCRAIESCPKFTYARIDGNCASAAYKIASATDYIVATESSMIGGIGSIVTLIDTKDNYTSMGIKMHIFTNKEAILKSLGHDFGSLTEEQAKYLQERADYLGTKFIEYVKHRRPNVSDEAFTGATFSTEQAIELGLIDQQF